MWRVVRGILLVGANLAKFNILVEKTYKRCNSAEESISHTLLHCYKAREVWGLQGWHRSIIDLNDLLNVFVGLNVVQRQ